MRNLWVTIIFENSHQIKTIIGVILGFPQSQIHHLGLQIEIQCCLIGYLILFHLVQWCLSLGLLFLLANLKVFVLFILLLRLIDHLRHFLLLLWEFMAEVLLECFEEKMVGFWILLISIAFFGFLFFDFLYICLAIVLQRGFVGELVILICFSIDHILVVVLMVLLIIFDFFVIQIILLVLHFMFIW